MHPSLTYAVVTAVRDEVSWLGQLADCLRGQTMRPLEWRIVDTGSTDGTVEEVERWIGSERWIRLTTATTSTRARGAVIAAAVEAGVRVLGVRPDILVIVDADVSFQPEYFARLLAAFERLPRLGMASGCRYEEVRGRWRRRHVTGTSVEAQCRAYRWACLQDVLPLERHMGWDGIDEVKANVRGWTTVVLDDLGFRHHRRIGGRERSSVAAWRREGEAAHFMGYRPYYAVIRSLYRSLSDPTALALGASFVEASLRRRPRVDDPDVRAYVRRQQSALRFPRRAAEALGLGRRPPEPRVAVLLVANSGGHVFELAALRDVWMRFSHEWVTVRGPDLGILDGERVHFAYGPTTRSISNLLRNAVLAWRLLRATRPAVILTTGAALSVPFAWVGRLLGTRVVYIECSGRVGVSLSCRLVAPVAHRLYVQWPEATALVPRARYVGRILFSTE
jgi:glycosyltransferase involved in cell wall biosynthesis